LTIDQSKVSHFFLAPEEMNSEL